MLGVKVSNITQDELLENIQEILESKEQYFLTTPNPEMLVAASRDEEFRKILNYAEMAIPDGFGLMLASRILGPKLKERITGVDLVWQLAALAEDQQYRMFLIGGDKGVAEETAKNLQKVFPKIHIDFHEAGHIPDPKNISREIITAINKAQPNILCVALGHGKQEKFIFHNLDSLPSVNLAVGIGGAFDYISGNVSWAPKWVRKIGLEWLYRLLLEPTTRIKRIYTAVIIFPYLVLKKKITGK